MSGISGIKTVLIMMKMIKKEEMRADGGTILGPFEGSLILLWAPKPSLGCFLSSQLELGTK